MEITPYPKNAKKHPTKQLKAIAESIKEFGWQQPIVVDKKGVIIVGHGRFMAYSAFKETLKLPEPEIKVADLTDKQARAYRLVMSRKDYHTQYEPIWYGWKEGRRLKPVENRKQSDVWDIQRPSDSPLHPTTKPIALVEKAIINSSKNEDIILEQFCGSGSTLIAAEKTGRVCYALELDPKYVDVIVQRYVDYSDDPQVKLNGETVSWEKSQ